jgi:hypothetical protein
LRSFLLEKQQYQFSDTVEGRRNSSLPVYHDSFDGNSEERLEGVQRYSITKSPIDNGDSEKFVKI